MSKYIKVKVDLNKTIKVENDNLDDAIKKAKEDFMELEMTDEWLNERIVTFEEDVIIQNSANYIAELFSKQVTDEYYKSDVLEFITIAFGNKDIINYIFDETINILENKYNINFVDKRI